jgi:hypothetical protein
MQRRSSAGCQRMPCLDPQQVPQLHGDVDHVAYLLRAQRLLQRYRRRHRVGRLAHPGDRGLHSCTFRLNVSIFVRSVGYMIFTQSTRQGNTGRWDQNGLG